MQVETRTDLNSIASIERVGRQPGSFNRKQFYNAQPPLHVARGASEFSDQAAVLVGEERGGAFVKRRLEVCTGLLAGLYNQGGWSIAGAVTVVQHFPFALHGRDVG
jgi:hypothetical protein